MAHFLLSLSKLPGSLWIATSGSTTAATATGELFSEALVLFLKLTDELSLRVLVDSGLVLDLLCLVSVTEGGESLLIVEMTRSDSAHHNGGRVTTKGVLEHKRELRVSVRDHSFEVLACAVIGKSSDNITEARE